jgi:SPP1 gp7 family putative phage head morphogenesis protein
MFNEQTQDIKQWLQENESEFSKSFVSKKDWASRMVNWTKYINAFAKEMKRICQIIIDEIGSRAFHELVDGEFDPYEQSIENYIDSQSLKVAKEVNAETEKQIRATLAQGIRNGEGLKELSARIMSVMGNCSTNRAMCIARTQASMMQNYADVQAWSQSGVVIGKEWYTAHDDRVCGFCADMDGKIIDLKEMYFDKNDEIAFVDSKGHEHTMALDYRSIGEPPLHPNCKCTLLPVIKEI